MGVAILRLTFISSTAASLWLRRLGVVSYKKPRMYLRANA